MAGTDTGRLRVQAMDLLIDALSNSTTVGATEFGSVADDVFTPAAVGANAAAMKNSLNSLIQADNGVVSDPNTDHLIAGNWKHQRQQHKGDLVALTYNSMAAGCDNVWDGELCQSGSQVPGQVLSPASMGCFTGVGTYTVKNGRSKQVAFRVEVEDHGMPSVSGANPGDIYRLRVWYPKNAETAGSPSASDGLSSTPGRVASARAASVALSLTIRRGGPLVAPALLAGGAAMAVVRTLTVETTAASTHRIARPARFRPLRS